jgi:hypothetical protein
MINEGFEWPITLKLARLGNNTAKDARSLNSVWAVSLATCEREKNWTF